MMATKRYNFKFHCQHDAIIIDRLDSKKNKQQYIRSLILSDIAADSLMGVLKMSDRECEPDHDDDTGIQAADESW